MLALLGVANNHYLNCLQYLATCILLNCYLVKKNRWQGFSVIGILFANSGCNPRLKFMKSLRIHSHEIGKCCCIFCMKFAHQAFILNQYNRNNKIIETTSDLAKFFNNFQYAGEYAAVRWRVRNYTQLCASDLKMTS